LNTLVNIVVLGLGSIGVRHVSNLLSMGYKNITLITQRTDFPTNWPEFSVYSMFENIPDDIDFTHALICSPTARHLNDLIPVIQAGIPSVFLEKPVSHTWEGIEDVMNMLQPHQKIFLGFDLRFDPGLNKINELLKAGAIGRVLSATAFVGQYLPDWRPHEDYRLGSSALKAKGGGVLLDLVHEFDYLFWLFGHALTLGAFYQTNPELEIETEDLADVLIKFDSGLTATLHLDYHQRKLTRYCHITGTNGSLLWDLATKKVLYTDEKGNIQTFDFKDFERNDRFVRIIQSFMQNQEDVRLTDFSEGLETLKMVLAAKKSSESHTFVRL
jgi:predicted dehydrogenase